MVVYYPQFTGQKGPVQKRGTSNGTFPSSAAGSGRCGVGLCSHLSLIHICLDALFSIPAAAVALAVLCNILWGSAFPFIKMGYRLFVIDSADTASILCFAGVRFMMRCV